MVNHHEIKYAFNHAELSAATCRRYWRIIWGVQRCQHTNDKLFSQMRFFGISIPQDGNTTAHDDHGDDKSDDEVGQW